MPKVAEIGACNMFTCPHFCKSGRKDHCSKSDRHILSGDITIPDGFPIWCELPDSSEEITLPSDRYTMKDLGHFLLGFGKSDMLQDYHGPSKQRCHDCLRAIEMFLDYIEEQQKEDKL